MQICAKEKVTNLSVLDRCVAVFHFLIVAVFVLFRIVSSGLVWSQLSVRQDAGNNQKKFNKIKCEEIIPTHFDVIAFVLPFLYEHKFAKLYERENFPKK